jgi:hypothetical protein
VGERWVKEVLTCFVVLFLEGLMNTAMEKWKYLLNYDSHILLSVT